MRENRLWLPLFVLLAGCSSPAAPTLRVDLRTDMRPALEFDAVRVEIGALDLPTRFDQVANGSQNYLRGVRLGDASVDEGQHDVRVTLFRDGEEVLHRDVSAEARPGFTVVTVVITRDCAGVACPAPAGDPVLESCLGGQCVDPRCTVETPEFCPPGCGSDAECPSDGCLRGSCTTGACLQSADDTLCGPGETCTLTGCVSTTDAGLDAGADAGTEDSGHDIGFDVGDDIGTDAGVPGCPHVDPDTVFLFDFQTATDRAGLTGVLNNADLTEETSPCGGRVLRTAGATDSEGYFLVPSAPAQFLSTGSLDFWVRFPAAGPADRGIVSRDELNIGTPGQLTLFRTSGGNLVLRLQQSPPVEYFTCSPPVDDREWHRIGVNFGVGGLELWLDGALQTFPGPVTLFGGPKICSDRGAEIGIDGTNNPFIFGADAHVSAPGSHEPVSGALHGIEIDHARLSRVRRDYAAE